MDRRIVKKAVRIGEGDTDIIRSARIQQEKAAHEAGGLDPTERMSRSIGGPAPAFPVFQGGGGIGVGVVGGGDRDDNPHGVEGPVKLHGGGPVTGRQAAEEKKAQGDK